MIATGAVLWKPLFITRFMTGEIIPAAKVLHSNEALVVFLIIVRLAYLQRHIQPRGLSAEHEHLYRFHLEGTNDP